MKLDSRVKGGLAWAGLVVILAVPAADILTGKPTERAATLTSDIQPVKSNPLKPAVVNDPVTTASVAPMQPGDPVENYVNKNKKLPSYISDGGTAVPRTPTAIKPVAPAAVETQVASLPVAPPIPLPRSMRPTAPVVATAPVEEQPLIVDEGQLASSNADAGDPVVTREQLAEWDSGSLEDYLAQAGLLDDSAEPPQSADTYDPDGFFLSDGPNQPRRIRPPADLVIPVY